MPAPNELERLIGAARDAGWRVSRQTTGHRLLCAPDGVTTVTAPTVPSDRVGLAAFRDQLGAAGLVLPEPEAAAVDGAETQPDIGSWDLDAASSTGGWSAAERLAAPPGGTTGAVPHPSTTIEDHRRRTRDNAKVLADAPKLTAIPSNRGRVVTDPSEADAEQAVRHYLSYLADPEGMRDATAIADAEEDLAAATDPIEKLKAMAALRKAHEVDSTAFELGFTRHAKDWADAEGITVEDFLALGVSPEILAAAGFANAGRARPTSVRNASTPRSGSKARLSYENDVVPAVAALQGEWKLSDLADVLQRDVQSTRNALRRLLDDKKVEEAGLDTSSRRPGRTPKLYRSVAD